MSADPLEVKKTFGKEAAATRKKDEEEAYKKENEKEAFINEEDR